MTHSSGGVPGLVAGGGGAEVSVGDRVGGAVVAGGLLPGGSSGLLPVGPPGGCWPLGPGSGNVGDRAATGSLEEMASSPPSPEPGPEDGSLAVGGGSREGPVREGAGEMPGVPLGPGDTVTDGAPFPRRGGGVPPPSARSTAVVHTAATVATDTATVA